MLIVYCSLPNRCCTSSVSLFPSARVSRAIFCLRALELMQARSNTAPSAPQETYEPQSLVPSLLYHLVCAGDLSGHHPPHHINAIQAS